MFRGKHDDDDGHIYPWSLDPNPWYLPKAVPNSSSQESEFQGSVDAVLAKVLTILTCGERGPQVSTFG